MSDEQPNHLYAAYYKGYTDGMKKAPQEVAHVTKTMIATYSRYYCGACGGLRQRVYQHQKFCPECGTRLNWEDVKMWRCKDERK